MIARITATNIAGFLAPCFDLFPDWGRDRKLGAKIIQICNIGAENDKDEIPDFFFRSLIIALLKGAIRDGKLNISSRGIFTECKLRYQPYVEVLAGYLDLQYDDLNIVLDFVLDKNAREGVVIEKIPPRDLKDLPMIFDRVSDLASRFPVEPDREGCFRAAS